ncbi:MAG: electron transfer flavoprotein subunit beta/FixA family protein, partial [Nitrospirales bacterium]|nr:electron transfer flavoprotein subunit beta/FixA family protein [Nitrospirales bacterium]
LREAISMGADDACLISDRAFAGADTLATSYTLCKAIEKIGFDVIICGKQAVDGDTGQVGPELAELLNIPHIAYVKKVVDITGEAIRVQRAMDDGYDTVSSSIPVLLTAVKELNTPRLPSLKGKMAAKKAIIRRLGLDDLGIEKKDVGLDGSPTKVRDVFSPERKKEKQILQGSVEEQVNRVIEELKRLQCI